MPREGTLWREGEDTIHDPKLEKTAMNKKQKRQNFWFYHKWHVIIALAVVIIGGYFIYDVLHKTEYDYTIGLITEESVPTDIVGRMENLISEKGEDLNGDGQVLVHIENYIVASEGESAAIPNMQMASVTKLMSDMSSMQSVIFFTDDKSFQRYQKDSTAFSYLDGTTPKDGADDYDKMRLPWEDLTALSAGDWTFYGKDTDGNDIPVDVSGDMKNLSASLRVFEGTDFAKDEAKASYYQKNVELLKALQGK